MPLESKWNDFYKKMKREKKINDPVVNSLVPSVKVWEVKGQT